MARRALALTAAGWMALLAWPSSAAACSPPFERPTIRALGPAQLVVVGTVGERVPGGRLFHVERWFNGGEPETPIVIGFKEGEPVGDCSYPVSTDERKIIAPSREPDGSLYADLATLQADPASEEGRRYIDEATTLFGPGVVPEPAGGPSAPDAAVSGPFQVIALAALVAAVAGVLIVAFGELDDAVAAPLTTTGHPTLKNADGSDLMARLPAFRPKEGAFDRRTVRPDARYAGSGRFVASNRLRRWS